MSDDAQRWKEKYLQSIEQQEKLERRWAARLDLLRRGLVRSTLAAEGTDRAVDQCMKEMREVVRTDDMDAALPPCCLAWKKPCSIRAAPRNPWSRSTPR
jgi:diguanylate cyclase